MSGEKCLLLYLLVWPSASIIVRPNRGLGPTSVSPVEASTPRPVKGVGLWGPPSERTFTEPRWERAHDGEVTGPARPVALLVWDSREAGYGVPGTSAGCGGPLDPRPDTSPPYSP